jgi:hypothetical protein
VYKEGCTSNSDCSQAFKTSKSNDTTKLTLPLIERVVKNAFKTHHAVLDFDAGFVNGFMPAMIDGVIL